MAACAPDSHQPLSNTPTNPVRKLLWRLMLLVGGSACALGTVRSLQAPQGFGPAIAFLGFFAALAAAYVLRPDGRYGRPGKTTGSEPR